MQDLVLNILPQRWAKSKHLFYSKRKCISIFYIFFMSIYFVWDYCLDLTNKPALHWPTLHANGNVTCQIQMVYSFYHLQKRTLNCQQSQATSSIWLRLQLFLLDWCSPLLSKASPLKIFQPCPYDTFQLNYYSHFNSYWKSIRANFYVF